MLDFGHSYVVFRTARDLTGVVSEAFAEPASLMPREWNDSTIQGSMFSSKSSSYFSKELSNEASNELYWSTSSRLIFRHRPSGSMEIAEEIEEEDERFELLSHMRLSVSLVGLTVESDMDISNLLTTMSSSARDMRSVWGRRCSDFLQEVISHTLQWTLLSGRLFRISSSVMENASLSSLSSVAGSK